jgi:H+-translocating NAD(P) transhydrogenase subunit alpha
MPAEAPPLTIGVPKETASGERRVSIVPSDLRALKKSGFEVVVEAGAGFLSGFTDAKYTQQGARIVGNRAELNSANIIVHLRAGAADASQPLAIANKMQANQILIALCDPLCDPKPMVALAERQATTFALELMPRISRAQSMDVLSSMATIAGYKAVILAADASPRMFPMLMTAAGTLTPAKIFVIGAGVAGLQAIATARRLGAIVSGYDVRAAAREQIQSVGGKPVDLGVESGDAETKGGYAKAMGDDFIRRQQAALGKFLADSDVLITTAAVPGKKAPVLVTSEMVAGMAPGSVIVDLAAERGGNCALTKSGETIDVGGVTIIGPENLPSTVASHASQMFSRNVTAFLLHMRQLGLPELDLKDEIIRETLVTRSGEVVHPVVRDRLGSLVS